jgi:glycosyltransferase involved in cell wall biosynthesis
MRLALLFGPLPTGARPLDLRVADTSPRGMTGTDNSFVGYAREMVARGHEVHALVVGHEETAVGGIHIWPWKPMVFDFGWMDAVVSWCDPDPLEAVAASCVRIVDCQLNNFDTARTKHSEFVDVYAAPSASLARRLAKMAPGRWEVLPNGCDPDAYDLGAKVPGLCIYTSSPDRGLHVALTMWPTIRAAVPNATLKIYYHSMQHLFDCIETDRAIPYWTNQEQARRATIIRDLIDQPGVEHVGSVSRVEMANAYSEAMVLAYPADTIKYTEGFGVAVLEGLASGAVPVISSVDCFGEVYGGACPMVEPTAWENRHEWAEMVIRALTDEPWRQAWVDRGRETAAVHAWPVLGERLERMILEAKARKRS